MECNKPDINPRQQDITDEQWEAIENYLLSRAGYTIGYAESDNRKEFTKGAQIAISKSIEYLREIFEPCIHDLRREKEAKEGYRTELRTIADIIKDHMNYDE